MLTTFIYIIWWLLPASLFTLSFWNFLERFSDKKRGKQSADFFKQGIFCSFCVAAAMIVDRYPLPWLYNRFLPDIPPLTFYRIILLPLILYIGAKLFGGSREILIGDLQSPKSRRGKK